MESTPPVFETLQFNPQVFSVFKAFGYRDRFYMKYWSGWPFPSPGDLPNPGIKPRSPTLQMDSLPTELQEKPKNTRVCSLSLLQGIFPTQESNWGLLHCRRILYQLSYEESPLYEITHFLSQQ